MKKYCMYCTSNGRPTNSFMYQNTQQRARNVLSEFVILQDMTKTKYKNGEMGGRIYGFT